MSVNNFSKNALKSFKLVDIGQLPKQLQDVSVR